MTISAVFRLRWRDVAVVQMPTADVGHNCTTTISIGVVKRTSSSLAVSYKRRVVPSNNYARDT